MTDQLGSVRQVINSTTGQIVQQMDYDEFGNVTNSSGQQIVPMGFAGGMYDSQTGLTKFGARDYDAVIGRWTKKDPISFSGSGSNLYIYCFNDALNLSDPSGKYICSPQQVWLSLGLGFIEMGFSIIRGEDATKIIQNFAIGALCGLIGGAEYGGSVSNVAVGTFLGFGADVVAQKVVQGKSWNSLNSAEVAFSSIVGFASAAYGSLFNEDLAGTALLITIFVAVEQDMILAAVQ